MTVGDIVKIAGIIVLAFIFVIMPLVEVYYSYKNKDYEVSDFSTGMLCLIVVGGIIYGLYKLITWISDNWQTEVL